MLKHLFSAHIAKALHNDIAFLFVTCLWSRRDDFVIANLFPFLLFQGPHASANEKIWDLLLSSELASASYHLQSHFSALSFFGSFYFMYVLN